VDALPPLPYDDYLGELVPIAGWWIALHTVQFDLRVHGRGGLDAHRRPAGIAAKLSRVAAVVFAIFYNAFDALAGISTGILARAAGED
jgi:hypothetical protein